MRRPRAWALAGAGALALALAGHGAAAKDGAEAAPPATGATPAAASLPEGHVPPLPDGPGPADIGPREKVEGFFVGAAPQDIVGGLGGSAEYAVAIVAPDAATLAHPLASRANGSERCLVDGGTPDTKQADDADDPRDWPATCESSVTLRFERHPKAANPAPVRRHHRRHDAGDLHAVRVETFVPGTEGRASLAMTDAWVDGRTHGARLIGRSTLPVALVFHGPNGLDVYAARDGAAVRVVVHAPARASDDRALAEKIRQSFHNQDLTLPAAGLAQGDASHVLFALRPGIGGGQMATYDGTALLPSLEPPGPAPEGEVDEARGERLLEAMRQRPFKMSMSATATASDASPVMSFALGWAGRERAQ